MIRIVCRQQDTSPARAGGTPVVSMRTFDLHAPELERWLADHDSDAARDVVGAEVLVDTVATINLTPELAQAIADGPRGRLVALKERDDGKGRSRAALAQDATKP